MGKPERKISLRRYTCTWKDNIKMDLKEGGIGARTGLIWLRIGRGGRFL
jgi:hypothetical protein